MSLIRRVATFAFGLSLVGCVNNAPEMKTEVGADGSLTMQSATEEFFYDASENFCMYSKYSSVDAVLPSTFIVDRCCDMKADTLAYNGMDSLVGSKADKMLRDFYFKHNLVNKLRPTESI